MKYGRYGWSHLFVSWGLGIVFLWIGLNIFVHPDAWIGFVPQNPPGGISREVALKVFGVIDTTLGVLLIMRWWQKLVAIVAAIHLLGILVTNGLDAVVIRDVGLLGAALALVTWPTKYRRHKWWKFWQKKSSPSSEES